MISCDISFYHCKVVKSSLINGHLKLSALVIHLLFFLIILSVKTMEWYYFVFTTVQHILNLEMVVGKATLLPYFGYWLLVPWIMNTLFSDWILLITLLLVSYSPDFNTISVSVAFTWEYCFLVPSWYCADGLS